MADKRITEVDFIDSLQSDESFFVNQNNAIKQINKSDIVFGISNGGTGATTADEALINLGINSTASELNYLGGVTSNIQEQLDSKADAIHEHSASDISSGVLPLEYGGTGASVSANANAIIKKDDSGEYLSSISTASGAMYATATNGQPQFGTLPIAQGGIGSSDGATGLKNLLASGETVLSSYQYGDTLPDAGMVGRIFYKKVSS